MMLCMNFDEQLLGGTGTEEWYFFVGNNNHGFSKFFLFRGNVCFMGKWFVALQCETNYYIVKCSRGC